jgi:hypothetical protein
LNGVVLANEVIVNLRGGWPVAEAIVAASVRTMLTTGAVAALLTMFLLPGILGLSIAEHRRRTSLPEAEPVAPAA